MRKRIFRLLVVILIFYRVFCTIHVPLQIVSEKHRDAQISSTVHPTHHIQSQQMPDSEGKVYDITFFFCESVFSFEIARFIFEVLKTPVYIWQLPRANIGGIMMETNECSIIPTKLHIHGSCFGRFTMDYKKEIIELIEKCTNDHWIEVIYVFVKRLIG